MLNIIALLVTLTAVFAYLNHRFIGLPSTIGVMVLALVASLLLIAAAGLGIAGPLGAWVETLIAAIDFNEVLMHGMLSLLLFAGALHVNLSDLADRKWVIGSLATVGVVVCTFLVAGAAYGVFALFGMALPFLYCLLFGALIAPTDPIAVLGVLKSAGAPHSLEVKITGESLFNDGIAVVVFVVLLRFVEGSDPVTVTEVLTLFVEEALGGLVLGLVLGFAGYFLLKRIDQYDVEILLTLALVLGGYALALYWHFSGPIAMVVAGLLIGNHGRLFAMSDKSREHLDTFWELVDEILNAVLFVLIGLEMLVLPFELSYLLLAPLLIAAVLLSRLLSVGLPIQVLRRVVGIEVAPHAIKLLTWGGIKGGISVALALALPSGPEREAIITVTYAIVLFSIMVQGLTIGRLVQAVGRATAEPGELDQDN